MTEPGDELSELEARLQAAEHQVTQGPLSAAERIAVRTAEERSEQRSRVAKIVIWTYAIGLAVTALYLMGWGVADHSMQTAAEKLLDLVKTALIPVVTFVIGHYFGASR